MALLANIRLGCKQADVSARSVSNKDKKFDKTIIRNTPTSRVRKSPRKAKRKFSCRSVKDWMFFKDHNQCGKLYSVNLALLCVAKMLWLANRINTRNVNNSLNTNIYSYLESSGGQSFNLYLNIAHFFNTSVNKTSVAA